MSRAQLALNVDDLDEAITFYSKLFNTTPAKVKPGYANFAVIQPPLKLVLIENPGHGGTLNHLGVEVESSEAVHAEIARLADQGMFTEEEMGTTCCFATQDKVWVTGPAGERWEVYTVLADSESRSSGARTAGARLVTQAMRGAANDTAVVEKLSLLDRLLPVWIGIAMATGLLVGRFVPALNADLNHVQVDGISLPIALGLLIMMYPVLAKVRYDRLDTVTGDHRLLLSSLLLNWVIGPALMFVLAWLWLPDLPEYRTGLIIVGLARCIAMVIIWNDLACGDREAAAVLVALNSIFQVAMFAVLGWFYLSVLPGWLGLQQTTISTSPWRIAKSVMIFLGIPLIAGYLSRRFGEKAKGRGWYESRFLPRVGPWALYGLLFTIVILFALQGDQIISRPIDVARIAMPLLAYFAIMWGGGYILGAMLGLGYQRTTTLAFTAAGNNFELAIAVAIATFGATSGQALAGVVGPLIEVPVLVGLVYVSLALRPRFDRSAR